MSDRAVTSASNHAASWYPGIIAIGRIAMGCFWACNAYFSAQTSFIETLTNHLASISRGHAQTLTFWSLFWSHCVTFSPHAFIWMVVIGEGLIALCLISGASTKLACGLGILLSAFAWSTQDARLLSVGANGALTGDSGIMVVCILALAGLMLSGAGRWYVQYPQTDPSK